MSRKLRFIPEGGAVVEATSRTIQGRLLLRPSPQLNEIIVGVLGRAQRLCSLEILGYVFLANHYLCGTAHEKCYMLSKASVGSFESGMEQRLDA